MNKANDLSWDQLELEFAQQIGEYNCRFSVCTYQLTKNLYYNEEMGILIIRAGKTKTRIVKLCDFLWGSEYLAGEYQRVLRNVTHEDLSVCFRSFSLETHSKKWVGVEISYYTAETQRFR